METASRLNELRRLETMAHMNTEEYGERLQKLLQARKEFAQERLKGNETSVVTDGIDYLNRMICEVLAIPYK